MLTNFISKIKLVHLNPVIYGRYKNFRRGFANSQNINPLGVSYQPEFTNEQQKHILQILNETNAEQLVRFNLPKSRIKKLDDWRKKNGRFNSIIDVLDVEGLGVKMLDKLCKKILQVENGSENIDMKEKPARTRGQILTPLMSHHQSKELTSCLGVNLYATGISWARIERAENRLSDWNYFEYNLGSKKITPSDALQLVLNACNEIPTSDVYIFEAPISVTPTAQQSPISVAAYAQRVQLLSMLITLLSTSPKHNSIYAQTQEEFIKSRKSCPDSENIFQMDPKVFFLRHRLPARMFRTLIGTERVSAATTVSNILANKISDNKRHYSPISVTETIHKMYEEQLPVTRELLGQALMLTMAFMDVCIYRNPDSLKAISSNSR